LRGTPSAAAPNPDLLKRCAAASAGVCSKLDANSVTSLAAGAAAAAVGSRLRRRFDLRRILYVVVAGSQSLGPSSRNGGAAERPAR
jgi:hypothetical protein